MKKIVTNSLRALPLLLWLLTMTSAYAQQVVHGKVSTDSGEVLPGVNVLLKGTTTGTTTDMDGKFTLSIPGPDAVLVFSFVGYLTEEIAVGNQTNLQMELVPDLKSLTEVVVIGYGTQRQEDVTTAVEQVKPKNFVPGAVRNVGELLRGKVAGLSIGTPSGDPKAQTEILLRGITSLYGSSAPLVLIDGYTGDLNSISPSDIESVDILKDASSSAIYGTRGKNGVILITTKKAKGEMTPVVEYSGYVATDRFRKTADFLSASDVRSLIGEGRIAPSYDLGGDTDWLKQITRKPVNHFHNLSLRGGTARTHYVVNTSYQKAEGVFLASQNEEFKIRFDLDHYLIKDKLKVGFNVLRGQQQYGSFNSDVYRQALIRNPTDKVIDSTGKWVEHTDQFQYENPVARIKELTYDDKRDWVWLTGSASYFPIKQLELKIVGSQHVFNSSLGTYESKQHISNVRDNRNGQAYVSNNKTVENFLDLTANYSQTFDKHRISGLLGYSYLDSTNTGSSISNYNFPSDNFSYHSIEQGQALRDGKTGAGVDSYLSNSKLAAFFARVGYGFNDRYNLLASVRYEGSSRFGSNHKWALFPAVSAGWTISNEAFLKGVTAITNLKLRAGYGRTGSISSAPYQSLTRYSYSPPSNPNQYYFNGTDWVKVLSPLANPNPNLGWETNVEYNVGLDFGVLENRITGTINVYDRSLKDLVFDYPVPVPPNLVGTTRANGATMTNKGVEVSLNIAVIQKGKFEWTSNLNYSRNSNRLQSLSDGDFKLPNNYFYAGYTGDPIQLSTHKLEVGSAVGNFYGYKSLGLVTNSTDPAKNGTWLIEGANGEQKSIVDAQPSDRQILGNGLPKWYGAWNNNFRYGNFDLNVTMRGAFDYQILNFQRMFYENSNIIYNRLQSAFEPIDGQLLKSPQSYVSHYIENGDYWKIDNVTLGYIFPTASNRLFKSARVYVSVSNLAVITKYKGLDPEVSRVGLSPGNDDRDKYPTVRTFTVGTNLTF